MGEMEIVMKNILKKVLVFGSGFFVGATLIRAYDRKEAENSSIDELDLFDDDDETNEKPVDKTGEKGKEGSDDVTEQEETSGIDIK